MLTPRQTADCIERTDPTALGPREDTMAALALDIGTSVIKAVVLSDEGEETAVARATTTVLHPRPGRAEQDMDALWDAVVVAVRAALTQARSAPRFVSVTAQGDGCWLVDGQGRPTGPAVLWSDARAADLVEEWRAAGVLDEAFRRTGSLPFPGLPTAVLGWLARHDPERLARSATALTCGGWLFLRLTGRPGIDTSDASAPYLDARTRTPDPDLWPLFGLAAAHRLMPPLRDDGERTAPLTRPAARRLGLPEGLPVVMAPYDVVCTALGVGAVEPGQACTVLGTTLCTAVVRTEPDTGGEPRGLTLAHGPDGRVLRAFPTLAGTEVLTWAGRLLGTGAPARLAELAAQAPPGAGGIVFLPYLSPAGERAPFLDPYARGTFWGLSLEHGRADIARAVFEGLSLVVRDCLTAPGTAAGELRLSGGGAQSELWCRLIADVTGLPVLRAAGTEHGAKGAFLTGLVATGAEPDLRTAAARYVHPRTTRAPDPAMTAFYSALHDDFLALRALAAAGGHRLAAARARTPGDTTLLSTGGDRA
ncbi:FGGY family carbohydrate kinase [Streptomyces gamaensis]|uniref:FGGY family carbohydrate kinase n=1 Tax=Streptomyces gamaensis TaxID=1763542 RepID=A0ABW0Z8P3_9ACTN